jgi:hypothetical protein
MSPNGEHNEVLFEVYYRKAYAAPRLLGFKTIGVVAKFNFLQFNCLPVSLAF